MQVVIPIAGRGKRMASHAEGPKQLLPVAGRPIVEYTLDALPEDIDELLFVVGGPHEARIREYFGREHGGRKVTYVQQSEALGLGHAIQRTAPVIRDRFLIVTPDDIFATADLQAMVEQPDLAALAKRHDQPEKYGVFVCDADGCLVRAVEKPKEFISNLVAIGPYLLDSEFFDVQVPPSARGEIELPDLVQALVRERGRRVKVVEASFWLPVNDPEQLSAADQAMLAKRAVDSVQRAEKSHA